MHTLELSSVSHEFKKPSSKQNLSKLNINTDGKSLPELNTNISDSQIILDKINLKFEQNISYAIMGVSGSGKSTLLSILSGLIKPTSGSVFFDSRDIFSFDNNIFLNKNIGLVFQEPNLLNELTVLENVMLKGLISKNSFVQAKKEAINILEKLGLGSKLEENTNFLSGGEQQRAAIARAIFSNPNFLIADEPTAHLDSKNKKILLDLLVSLKSEKNLGLIIATHDIEVSQICDIVINLENGQAIINK